MYRLVDQLGRIKYEYVGGELSLRVSYVDERPPYVPEETGGVSDRLPARSNDAYSRGQRRRRERERLSASADNGSSSQTEAQ
jgi:hypothetical protein